MVAPATPHIRPQSTVDMDLRLSDIGLRDRDNATICGVAVKTIRRWRRLYRRDGLTRGQSQALCGCPLCDGCDLDQPAYAHLLGWYLGDGHIARYKDKPVCSLRIYNDLRYPGLNAEIVRRHPGRFLRGLFHSDGCRITNWTTRPVAGEIKRYEYPRYFFKNESEDILGLCTWALDLLGIAWKRPKRDTVSVARKDAVAKLDEHVGPKF